MAPDVWLEGAPAAVTGAVAARNEGGAGLVIALGVGLAVGIGVSVALRAGPQTLPDRPSDGGR